MSSPSFLGGISQRWRPRSLGIRILVYALTASVVLLLAILSVRVFRAKAADDCNKPSAPVVVPQAPPGLIVDAPCTDGSKPAPKPPARGR